MNPVSTPLPGVILIELDAFRDARGYFLETYHLEKYRQAGMPDHFVQDNFSYSSQGTLRGLHAQLRKPQAKLVRVISGEIWDVVVDIRPDSPTYRKWFGVNLSAQRPMQVYVPVGFAHGFCVLSETAEVEYKCSDFYDPSSELHLLWNDPDFQIQWPIKNPNLSTKDSDGKTLREVEVDLRRSFPTPKSK
jgi:dTDP-4-dehydrorhamnose 3,5-epimerase